MSKAWVFDESCLHKALALYTRRLANTGVLAADEEEAFAECVAGFLYSNEAAPMRVAELEGDVPPGTGDPNSVIR